MDYTNKYAWVDSYLKNHLKESRVRHIYGVRDTAVCLALKFGADVSKAELAAMFHDFYKGLSGEELNSMVRELGLPEKYLDNNNLAHSKLAAIMMKKEYGIDDEDVLNAVSYHTTGRAGMSLLEKIIYLADAIEPGRNYPGVEELRRLALEDLDKACLFSMKRTVDFVKEQGKELDGDTLSALEFIENEQNKKRI
ncbi:MAG: bis(5'-nucleosyl)-tetraphosphatase (symmetrical) YqeK [Clostridia bacterium]|nr:bis(5'-nucleosyl)-tetraphosphatase (symmetrical) YqeK [Clostridia bacterium]